jgi:hypothetical protein
MSLDIRIPIGGMFGLLGLLLLVYGLATAGDETMYARSLNININLLWGGVMLIFGGLMLGFGLRKRPSPPGSDGLS